MSSDYIYLKYLDDDSNEPSKAIPIESDGSVNLELVKSLFPKSGFTICDQKQNESE